MLYVIEVMIVEQLIKIVEQLIMIVEQLTTQA